MYLINENLIRTSSPKSRKCFEKVPLLFTRSASTKRALHRGPRMASRKTEGRRVCLPAAVVRSVLH